MDDRLNEIANDIEAATYGHLIWGILNEADPRFKCLIVVTEGHSLVEMAAKIVDPNVPTGWMEEQLQNGTLRVIVKEDAHCNPEVILPQDHFHPDQPVNFLLAPPAIIFQKDGGVAS
jgi:hypothetical protein